MKRILLAAAAVSIPVCPVLAQDAFPAASAQAKIAAVAPSNVLKEGVELRLATMDEMNSKRTKLGDRFNLEVVEAVELNGQVVIPVGARAVGEVTRVKKKGMWGKSGKLDTRLLYVEVGGRKIRITGASDDKGRAGTVGVVAAVAFVPIAGFFVTGTSAVIPARTPVRAYLNEEVPVVFAAPQTQSLIVPASAPQQ